MVEIIHRRDHRWAVTVDRQRQRGVWWRNGGRLVDNGVGRPLSVVLHPSRGYAEPMHQRRRHPSNRPFLAAPRTDFYHPARLIDAALQGLERGVRRAEGVGLVVGPPGTGKSLLLLRVAEDLRDDFDVALLCGARICTRRALWQAILAEIGEPYRGIDEGELRISVVERVRGLAATGSGLVLLVDEAHTMPIRLLEELRLLTTIPTPLPAVHLVLAGSIDLEERLAGHRLESLAQRIGGRFSLEALDHAETCGYLRAQMRATARDWDMAFAPGCDDAVFTATDGVPRLVNQVCDLTLLRVAADGRPRAATPADVEAAWAEIQRLPVPQPRRAPPPPAAVSSPPVGGAVIEFGELDAGKDGSPDTSRAPSAGLDDPWCGPDVEFVFEQEADPFAGCFAGDEALVERLLVRGPEDFTGHGRVTSDEGVSLGRYLAGHDHGRSGDPAAAGTESVPLAPEASGGDDRDMVVIEEDLIPATSAVRVGGYRDLFARLRRGGA
jgi:type II secretory pathway predicted ATPase ExeA